MNKSKTKLRFMVDPDFLKNHAYVENGIKILITDPDSIFITGILGESGRKMILDGAIFIFEPDLAKKLILNKVAVLA